MKHAIDFWRKQFRGEVPIKDDVDVTVDDIENCNLILWGDSESSRYVQNHRQWTSITRTIDR